ncbi:alpha/beta fold hydrolase family protein [Pseudomonas saliphila]|uniref:serine/threonine protein kinase n=1 Tax=Pseudomonas saliphila TaxID=2586906 RepID=UPI00123C3135|nr:serine/threonine protein kinase [Pseudomonas saliphila]
MKRIIATATLSFTLLGSYTAQADNFSYSEENAFMATIASTPLEQVAPVPSEFDVQQDDLSIRVLPDRKLPPVLSGFDELDFRLAWQDQPAPLMFLIAGTGSGFDTARMDYLKRVFWQAGMHVIVLSSPSNHDFIAAASRSGLPGLGRRDARDLHSAMSMAVEEAQETKGIEITEYHMAGFSLGALNAAFVGELDQQLGQFDFSRIVLLNPPVDLYTSITRLDALPYTRVKGVDGTDSFYEHIFNKLSRYYAQRGSIDVQAGLFADIQASDEALTDAELAMLIGAVFRFAAADLSFMSDVITRGGVYVPVDQQLKVSTSLTPYLRQALFCNFKCYIETQLYPDWQTRNADQSISQMAEETSLRSIDSYLRDNPDIAVVTNADDFILTGEDYQYLVQLFGERAFLYPRGGHGGNLQHKDVVARILSFVEGTPNE